jgi:DNA-binding transcriptional MerR regulator
MEPVRLTVGELGRMVGMAPRTIRAHQARRLLPPPVRQGRVAFYHADHVDRLETIKALQRRGFNLVAVQAILGTEDSAEQPDAVEASMADALRRLARERPLLVHALVRYGVVTPRGSSLRVVHPRVLRSALRLQLSGLATDAAIELLVEMLARVQPFADALVRSANRRLSVLASEPDPAVLAEAVAGLLTESFRAAVTRGPPRSR